MLWQPNTQANGLQISENKMSLLQGGHIASHIIKVCPKLREKKKIKESTQGGKPTEKRIHQVSADDQSEDVYEIDKVNLEGK